MIIDEAHERGVNSDILIGLLSRLVPMRRAGVKGPKGNILPPLKVTASPGFGYSVQKPEDSESGMQGSGLRVQGSLAPGPHASYGCQVLKGQRIASPQGQHREIFRLITYWSESASSSR